MTLISTSADKENFWIVPYKEAIKLNLSPPHLSNNINGALLISLSKSTGSNKPAKRYSFELVYNGSSLKPIDIIQIPIKNVESGTYTIYALKKSYNSKNNDKGNCYAEHAFTIKNIEIK